MDNQEDLILLFAGSEIDTKVLKEILDDNNISSLIRDDINSARAAGFGIGLGTDVNVYVTKKNLEKAQIILKEFKDSFSNK